MKKCILIIVTAVTAVLFGYAGGTYPAEREKEPEELVKEELAERPESSSLHEIARLLREIEEREGSPARMREVGPRKVEDQLAIELAWEVLRLRSEISDLKRELEALRELSS